MLYLFSLSCLQFDADEGLCRLLQVQNLNVLTVVIYQQLHHLHHTPRMALSATALPPRPLPELLTQFLPRLLRREGQDLLDCYRCDRFDGIDKL